jgi:hypothetical protein
MLRVSTYGNGVFERPLAPLPTAVTDGGPAAPLALRQNHPNPFNPSTVITFRLAAPGPVTLAVYDAGGRRVRTLVQERLASGEHRAAWDGTDTAGRRVASGTYVYRLAADGQIRSRSMTLLK